ncbi:hypothetical protein SDC9_190910 [bioreactor metagenome]|uniref:Uncharacterized protein n=1 Tax=bioreactor metagenome TaxID=1076179 RepID=A0A645HWC2_9ZZZZ
MLLKMVFQLRCKLLLNHFVDREYKFVVNTANQSLFFIIVINQSNRNFGLFSDHRNGRLAVAVSIKKLLCGL